MKTAEEYKKQWEEVNLLRLIFLAQQVYEYLNRLWRKTLIVANVILYIMYRAFKGLCLIVKLLLLTENNINKIERDETWIFRQIK